MTILIELQYLPTLEYFCYLSKATNIIIEKKEHFVKQSFRNRTSILTANGVSALSIPVIGGNRKVVIDKIEMDYKQKWVNNHWRAIQSAYGKSPFFEYYADAFQAIFYSEETSLFAFNQSLFELTLKLMQWELPITYSSEYAQGAEEGLVDLRSVIHPKTDYTTRNFYQPAPYMQLFGDEFAPNLSILDLLFCEGPNARNVILNSCAPSS